MGWSKKTKTLLISLGALVLMVATIPAAIWVTHTQTAQLANQRDRCSSSMASRITHKVVIKNAQVTPTSTFGKQCDTLTITNLDNNDRLIAFGPHEHHVSYDGISERVVGSGQSLTLTLITKGTFYFHDHSDVRVKGSFTVR